MLRKPRLSGAFLFLMRFLWVSTGAYSFAGLGVLSLQALQGFDGASESLAAVRFMFHRTRASAFIVPSVETLHL